MQEHQPSDRKQGGQNVHLRILETTDLHVHIMPYDYFADTPDPASGLAQTARLIHLQRADAANSLLFDNGDFLQGTPMSDWAATRTGPHPMIAAMNTLDYDAATLGNHEFNYGLPHLRDVMAQADFPFVAANITTAPAPLAPPWRILKKQVQAQDGTPQILNIGVIGFGPPQISDWEHYTLGAEVQTEDIIAAARMHVPQMRAAESDIVIALCHSGIGPEQHTHGMENAAVPLAAVSGIDVLLMGHTHGVFPGPQTPGCDIINNHKGTLHGKPAVMPGFHGSHLGQIDLHLTHTGTGWSITHHTSAAIPIATGPPDPAVMQSVKQAHQEVLEIIRAPMVTSSEPLFSHFARLAPSASLTLLSDAMKAAAVAALAGTDHANLPLLTAVAPYKAGGWGRPDNYVDVPPGPLMFRHASELYPYPNDMCLLALTGAEVRAWIERAAEAFLQITPGTHEQPLINPQMPSYNCDVLHGLRYQIDISQPLGRRLTTLSLANGTTLFDDAPVILATNGYRAAGGGGYAMARAARLVPHDRRPLRDILTAFLTAQTEITPRTAPVWSFRPLPDTSAWFESSPNGRVHLGRPECRHIRDDRAGQGGLHRYICTFADAPATLSKHYTYSI